MNDFTHAPSDAVSTRLLASLLAEADPARLERLRSRFPDQREVFSPEYVLGEPAPAAAPGSGADQARRMAAVNGLIHETLDSLYPAIERLQAGLLVRIVRARRLRLFGSAVATVSSAGAIATLSARPDVALAVSVLVLLGSLSALAGEHIERPITGGAKSLSELLGSVMAAEQLANDVKLSLLAGDLPDLPALVAVARKLSDASATLKQASLYGGVPLAA